MFSVHTTPEEFKNAAIITGQFGFVYEGIVVTPVEKLRPFWKCFPSTLKREAGVFKFLRFEERWRKAPFCDGLVWTVGQAVETIKAAFSNSSVRRSVNETLRGILFLRERNRTCLRRKQDDEQWHNFYNPNGNRRWYGKTSPKTWQNEMKHNKITKDKYSYKPAKHFALFIFKLHSQFYTLSVLKAITPLVYDVYHSFMW